MLALLSSFHGGTKGIIFYSILFFFCSQRPQVPVCTFTIIPQSATLVRIVYLGMYCLEITFRGGGLVSIRDGAYSRFDRTSVISDFMPTSGLRVSQYQTQLKSLILFVMKQRAPSQFLWVSQRY